MNHYRYHVFFCLNRRDDGAACCCDHGAEDLFEYTKNRVKKLGINGKGHVRINRAGCFDRCNEGPLLVVYPDAVWYTYVDREDLDEIIESHLRQGRPVPRLMV